MPLSVLAGHAGDYDIDDLRELLPWWVNLGSWVLVPTVGFLIGMFMVWLADRINRLRPDLTEVHWTEKARVHLAGTKLVSAQVLTHAALTGVLTYMMGSGRLTPVDPLSRAFTAAICVWVGGRFFQFRRARRVLPWLTASQFIRGQLFYWVVLVPVLLVFIVMFLFGPAEFGWMFVLIHGGGILALVYCAVGGSVRIGRTLGLIVPADERLQRIVDEAARRSGHQPKGAYLGRTPIGNALAMTLTNELVFTTKAMEELDDAQLLAITLHEIGHLKESRLDKLRRLQGVSAFVVLGMWRPIDAWLGFEWLVGLFVATVVLAFLGLRTVRRLETAADSHAHEHQHEEEEGVYARALERLHEVNLVPAVMRGKRQTHPNLYDRMVEAGVTPDYPQPEPPDKKGKQVVLLGVVSLLFYIGQILVFTRGNDYSSIPHAYVSLMASGGKLHAIGALGFHWQKDAPDKAVVALSICEQNSNWPEYPGRLARLLADRTAPEDQARARTLLARAEATLDDWGDVDWDEDYRWLREIIDDTRSKLGMPARSW